VNPSQLNLRGPSRISLEPFVCDVCGKKRNAGNGRSNHDRCSKLRQARRLAKEQNPTDEVLP